jgi:hypothetical protein
MTYNPIYKSGSVSRWHANPDLAQTKAIETRYKGYLFRSRLEARWAVFFDALGLTWEYEPEGFKTDAGWYLPDFRVITPQAKPIWYEIKPQGHVSDAKMNAFEETLCADLDPNQPSTARVALLSGDPITVLANPKVTICPRCGFICEPAYGFDVTRLEHPGLSLFEISVGCWSCDIETPSGGGNGWEDGIFGLGVTAHKGFILTYIKETSIPEVHSAAVKARSARFEHGETP